MEPKTQAEIQLGHMCNNRCVFCVSGQETGFGHAGPLPVEPILERISEAFERGHRKLTLLGGEPTLQPGFKRVVAHAVELGFEEIVLFTNGVKTARESFIDEVMALDGPFTWRISIQGANKLTHERTTRRPGSFDRIVQSLEHLARKNQRVTVNMCVVQSNFESVDEFPALLARYGVRQLHLDMVRPLDAGRRTEEEFRAMIPRYTDMVGPLERMVRGFPEGFDVNVGNLPYCIAPELARFIHHDGEETETIAVDSVRDLSRPWNKYFVKRRDKLKPESCRACVFDRRCSGIFEKYREMYGTDELVPITPERWRALDPELRLLGVHLEPVVDRLRLRPPPAPFDRFEAEVTSDASARVALGAGSERVALELGAPGDGAGSFDLFSVRVLEVPRDTELAHAGLAELWSALAEGGHRVWHPLAADALRGAVSPGIAARLARLRRNAPFGELEWRALEVSDGGRRVELALEAPGAERATVWLAERDGRPTGGYHMPDGSAPSVALRHGLGALMNTLSLRSARAGDDARA
jgi:MoaA/NifB/PqqE/SkfB family radical SAM enzyme